MITLKNKNLTKTSRPALALVFTLVVLVVLTTIVYTLTSRLATIRHRQQYIIDYQVSRYACDSAMKYALAAVEEMSLNLIKRDDKPDFSDLFMFDDTEYEQFLLDWEMEKEELEAQEAFASRSDKSRSNSFSAQDQGADLNESTPPSYMQNDPNFLFGEPNDYDDFLEGDDYQALHSLYADPNTISVPGPYGPPWPHVRKPIEIEIASAKATIEIEDENAKMPLIWATIEDKEVKPLAEDALVTFCEWMQMSPEQIDDFSDQLETIKKTKSFSLKKKGAKDAASTEKPKTPVAKSSSSRRLRRRTSKNSVKTKTAAKKRSAVKNTTDFAGLFHSPLLDRQTLAVPLLQTGNRHESPLKYLAIWGSKKVNINTAPRHVLEAAFTFGGDADEIAHEIIQKRREKPFKNIDELEDALYAYSLSIEKARPYITTKSTFFSIKVTAVSGSAKASAVATIIKNGNKATNIAIISN